jgi:hypothetical protein
LGTIKIYNKNIFIQYFQKFVYYVREDEFRYIISKLDESKIEKKILKLFKYVYL